MEKIRRPIAVFDSGVGGISVLRELVRLMPYEDFLYYGDSANAPYGTKTTMEVRQLTIEHTNYFLERNAKAVAIACNTATSAAVRVLREMYPNLPLVGIEPALKPAVTARPHSKILVMATPMTISEEKFHRLLAKYETMADIYPLACPGLMEFVEDGRIHDPQLIPFLEELLADAKHNQIESVVLGCTHYPFVKDAIAQVLGNHVEIYDGGYGTAAELKRRVIQAGLLEEDHTRCGKVVFENSLLDESKLTLCKTLLEV